MRAQLIVLFFLTSLIISAYLFLSFYGFDFTDEGFYLNSYYSTAASHYSASYFGFIYAFPFRLVGERISSIRILNVISTLTASVILLAAAQSRPEQLLSRQNRFASIAFRSFCYSGPFFLVFGISLTPSYNHLNALGILAFCSSLMLLPFKCDNTVDKKFLFLSFTGITVAIATTLLSKLSTCLVLVTLLLVFLACTDCKKDVKYISVLGCLVGVVVALLIVIHIHSGPINFFYRYLTITRQLADMGSGHTFIGLTKSLLGIFLYPPFGLFLVSICFQLILFKVSKYVARKKHLNWFSISSFLFLVLASAFLVEHQGFLSFTSQINHLNVWILSLPASTLVWLAFFNKQYSSNILETNAARFYLSKLILLSLVPFAYAFGSNYGIWTKAMEVGIIYTSMPIFLVSHFPRSSYASTSSFLKIFWFNFLICIVALSPRILAHFIYPYRQQELIWKDTAPVQVGKNKSWLRVKQAQADFIEKVRDSLNSHDFEYHDYILDLTGKSPGLIFAVGGKALGSPWILGGYSGSVKVFSKILDSLSCKDLTRAYIFLDHDGPRRLPLGPLRRRGLDIANTSHYKRIGFIEIPKTSLSDIQIRNLSIYKPIKKGLNCNQVNNDFT